MKKIYLLGNDVFDLMKKWGNQKGFRIPCQKFFDENNEELEKQIKNCFENPITVFSIEVEGLRNKLRTLINLSNRMERLPIISLDHLCVPQADYFIEISRLVKFCPETNSWEDTGLGARPGYPHIQHQAKNIICDLKRKKRSKIILTDDGCWTANTLNYVSSLFLAEGMVVSKILVGIMIKRESQNLVVSDIEHVYNYDSSIIVDWVWARDFYPGVPLSGRTVTGCKHNQFSVGAVYLEGFGDLFQWASISREKGRGFSSFCVSQAIKMFEKIEESSDKIVTIKDLTRVPYNHDVKIEEACLEKRFVDFLRERLANLRGT